MSLRTIHVVSNVEFRCTAPITNKIAKERLTTMIMSTTRIVAALVMCCNLSSTMAKMEKKTIKVNQMPPKILHPVILSVQQKYLRIGVMSQQSLGLIKTNYILKIVQVYFFAFFDKDMTMSFSQVRNSSMNNNIIFNFHNTLKTISKKIQQQHNNYFCTDW